jgi:amino acid permease
MSEITAKEMGDFDEVELPAQPQVEQKLRSCMTAFFHSFRRRTESSAMALGDADKSREAGDLTRLKRKLQTRHLQMIAIGGSIGCGLFIASGAALQTGGPGAVVLDFCIVGLMIFCTCNAMGELATLFPVQGVSSAYFLSY